MKNQIFRKFILLNFCLLAFNFLLQAQPPLRFSYQSIIRNPAGQALQNQSVGIRLSILQTSETGTAVYVETHSATTNASGLVTLQVGGGTAVNGSMATINWANGPYFIKTETDPEGGSNYTISGSSQLLSVPFALYSANGTPGPQGPAGPAGPQGATGPAGPQGATGAQGPIGQTGPAGAIGPAGPAGATGPAGQTGATGPQGPIGLTGAQGPQGVAGQNGQNGNNGKNALIRTTPETAGANCANGGVKIETGIDADGNGQLADSEVNASQTKFICNGSGSSGIGLPSNPPYGPALLYSCDGQFQYTPCIPKVVTNPVTQIYSRTASFSGLVKYDGGSGVSAYGFCWGTSPNPTINDSIAWISNPNQSLFDGGDGRLLPGTTYYVRAFATNVVGTGYGEQKTFTTPQPSTNPATDADGNTFTTVIIGTQEWMKENLKTSKYRNGSPIPNLSDTEWQSTTSGAYAIYNNDAANNSTYGKLYNWYAVADPRGLCPAGWHVPSDAEWTTLENFLGGASVAGGKMKSTGTIQAGTGLWNDPNTAADNSSGFTGLPGGYRNSNPALFGGIGANGTWWSSTEGSSTNAWDRYLRSQNGSSFRTSNYQKSSGYSVRCLRD